MTGDRAETIVVVAKQPRPGRVKTRLQAAFTATEAAELAAASLSDTLSAVRSSRARRRVLAWDGDPTGWDGGFEVVPQPPGDLAVRLAAAFAAVAPGSQGTGVLLIGMDTPQVSPRLLDRAWDRADAVLGLSDDGGFWAIGLRDVDPDAVFTGIPMSTPRTGAAQLARLSELGLRVGLLPPLRDVDDPADAEAIAARHPALQFSRHHTALVSRRTRQPVSRLFDQLYAGTGVDSRIDSDRPTQAAEEPVTASPRGLAFVDGVGRWTAPADPVDQMVVARCEAPVIDIGCGPGRMVAALQRSGRAALGIDISSQAVAIGARDGMQVLCRELADQLPAEGRWGTALLLDGNVGIGGDGERLIARCCELVGPGGLIICEVDPDPDRDETYRIVLSAAGSESEPMGWSCHGLAAIQRVASRLDLIVAEEWRAGGRAFVALRTAA